VTTDTLHGLVMCVPVSATPLVPHGGVQRPCERCGQQVWVTPWSLDKLDRGCRPVCSHKCARFLAPGKQLVPVLPPAEAVEACEPRGGDGN
jgi:hypothetical protein